MSISDRVEDFLKEHRVRYEVVPHSRAVSAKATAEAEEAMEDFVAKVVLVKANNQHVMTVIPASFNLDLFKLQDELATADIVVEKEKDFRDIFPDCEVGAMPPFGHLYGLQTLVDVRLTECVEIFIPTGDCEEGIRIPVRDYLRIARAEVCDLVAGD